MREYIIFTLRFIRGSIRIFDSKKNLSYIRLNLYSKTESRSEAKSSINDMALLKIFSSFLIYKITFIYSTPKFFFDFGLLLPLFGSGLE